MRGKICAIIAILRASDYILVTYSKGSKNVMWRTVSYNRMKRLVTYAMERCVRVGAKRYEQSRGTGERSVTKKIA